MIPCSFSRRMICLRLSHSSVGERGGRLVEDDEAGAEGERLEDLHHLPLGHAQFPDHRPGRQVDADFVHQRRHLAAERTVIHEAQTVFFVPPDVDVFLDRHQPHLHRLLIDGADPPVVGGVGGELLHQPAFEEHLPAGRRLDPRENPDQGGFPRAVLPDQRVDQPRLKREIHLRKGLDPSVMLREPPGLHYVFRHLPRPFPCSADSKAPLVL